MTETETHDRPLAEAFSRRQKILLMGSLMCSMFLGALDQTIMATATPHILADLGGFELFSWLFTSYMLASTVTIPLVGKLSDLYGRKVFVAGGVVLFMLASAGCGAAPDMPTLIAFRVLQGIGGGTVFAAVFATVADLFPPQDRAKFMALFTGTFSLAAVLGPPIGGLLTDHAGWRWVFFINIPFGLIAVPAIWRTLPMRRGSQAKSIDFFGAAWLSLGTVSLLLGLVWAHEEYGWNSPATFGLFAASAVLLALFLRQESRHPEPILPLVLFKNREFVIANLAVVTIAGAIFGAVSYLPIFVQTSLQSSATASGLITTPQSLGLLLTSIVGGQLVARTGRYKHLILIGAAGVFAGILGLLTLDTGSPKWHVTASVIVIGIGSGFFMPPMAVVVQNVVAHQYLGVATSARQFFMQIG